MNEAAHTISLISPSKSSSSFNTSNSDPTSFILNVCETRFASGIWNKTVRTCRDPIDTENFSNRGPEILVEWVTPLIHDPSGN